MSEADMYDLLFVSVIIAFPHAGDHVFSSAKLDFFSGIVVS